MAIEKISLIDLVGLTSDLDLTLLKCLQSGYFHPEKAHNSQGFVPVKMDNEYLDLLQKITKLASELSIPLEKREFEQKLLTPDEIKSLGKRVDTILDKVNILTQRKQDIISSMNQHNQALIQIKHLSGLSENFDDIFACEYVKVRFGRLPYDSFSKLEHYDDKTFFFFDFDHDKDYYWGVYFAPATSIKVVDDIFYSLHFERMRIPDYAHGTPEVAISNINAMVRGEERQLTTLNKDIEQLNKDNVEEILTLFSIIKFGYTIGEMRSNALTYNNYFHLIGFVPFEKEQEFGKSMADIKTLSYEAKPHDADPSVHPPVILKNNWFTRPFEELVKMYSLPSYNDIDPTPLVAISYTLLFGIMFGDVGQGAIIAMLGIFLAKKGNVLGKILARIGISSTFFGFVYGSVFGFEHFLDPFYINVLGFTEKPIHVFDSDMINILLGSAIGIGILLISVAMSITIGVNIKQKNYGKALFSNNGLAGLVLYLGAIIAVADIVLLKSGIYNTIYLICFIIIPFFAIFFRSPLSKLVAGKKEFLPKNWGEFIIENIFEMFEYVLSYLSNTMSFLRVGGFILSHAGMMSVVMALSEMVSAGASIFIIVFGNIFVMALEGMIVGIQVLRLEFYEIFSRCFEGNGVPYHPCQVDYTKSNILD